MRVKMLEDRAVVVDAINKIDAEAGEYYEMGDGVAQSLIDQGAAEAADDNDNAADEAPKKPRRRGAKADQGADENKDAADEAAGDAEEAEAE